MLKTVIRLPDGTEISSGSSEANAIQNITLKESANETKELSLGSVVSSDLEVKILSPNGILKVSQGDEVSAYKITDNGDRHLLGVFALEKPTRPSANSMRLVAHDRVTRLDRDLSDWLASLSDWPYSLYTFAEMVCDACDLTLANTSIPNGDFMVQPFSASGITGRAIMKWIGQAAGRFCRATPDGRIEFAWYSPVTPRITPGGEYYYFQNGLTYEDYAIHPIEKVQVHMNEDDVGVVWPDETGEKNTYVITGNYLLTTEDTQTLLPVVQNLYNTLQPVSYTPCKVTIPATLAIRAGSIVNITDRNGKQITAYVMTSTLSGNRLTLECTGSYRRDSTTAVNEQSYKALSGKILSLRTDVEGIFAENRDTNGKIASLQFDLDGIRTQVSDQAKELNATNQSITEVKQSADSVSVTVQKIIEDGATKVKTEQGYTLDDNGIHISRSDSDMVNTLDHTGMYVNRGDEVMLQANNRGVIATDVTVRNYLTIGHARFEEYSNGSDTERTACFFV